MYPSDWVLLYEEVSFFLQWWYCYLLMNHLFILFIFLSKEGFTDGEASNQDSGSGAAVI